MKTTILLSLIGTPVFTLSQPAWPAGVVAAVSTEEVSVVVSAAVAVVLAVFVAAVLAAQHVGGGVGTRGGGVGFGSPRFGGGGFRAAPYGYGGTHFAARSLGGPTGAFRYYNGSSSTSAARTYQFSGRANQSMKSNAGRNAAVARQADGARHH